MGFLPIPGVSPPPLSPLGMVKSVEIKNFRGLKEFEVGDFARINLIVGDNAVGKTALLEAIWLALSGSPDKGILLKQWRGMDITFQNNSGESVFEGIYADLFHDPKTLDPITIKLSGTGFENRQLAISHLAGEVVIPTKDVEPVGNRKDRRTAKAQRKKIQTLEFGQTITAPILLAWTDEKGVRYEGRVLLAPSGLRFEATGEKIPNSYLFAAQIPISATEAATQYSTLRKARDADRFRNAFLKAFDEITDLTIDAVGNSSMLLADVPWAKQLLPLPTLSGGTNRASAIMLALAHRTDCVVLVDEVESGIYHTRQGRFAAALIQMAREYKSQLIMTSHSAEWISNFLEAIGTDSADVAMWRMERIKNGPPHMRRFTVKEYKAGLSLGDMR